VSNILQRVITAAVAIPLIILICMAGGIWFFAFVALASALALIEFYGLASGKGIAPQVHLGTITGFFVTLSFFHTELRYYLAGLADAAGTAIPFPSQTQLLTVVIILGTVALALVELFRNRGSAIANLSATVLGILYVSLLFGTFVGIRELFTALDPAVAHRFLATTGIVDPPALYQSGGYTVISIFAMIWICDSAAYHFGSTFGKHKLFPRVSPNKSWEGAVAGFLFAIGTALIARNLVLPYLTSADAVIIGVIVGVFGQFGDLAESLLKRDAGVKDSSQLIPGHGGVFDRFDSLLFVSPLVYLYLDFVVFSP
jgi:phosphatidate cytidylyltransferase